jgi:hypothetical protein
MSGFQYAASLFGDRVRIRLESALNRLLWDTVSVVEKVQGLVLLDDGSYYIKVGGTRNHHGPSDQGIPLECLTPDNNHWATVEVLASIIHIATTWHISYPQEVLLTINDMSLPLGGMYDYGGSWLPPHASHRNGKDVDIRTEFDGANGFRGGIPIHYPRTGSTAANLTANDFFESLCRALGARALQIHGKPGTTEEHYHIYY